MADVDAKRVCFTGTANATDEVAWGMEFARDQGDSVEPVTGTVRSWSDEGGFGTIQVEGEPEFVWAHFSVIEPPGGSGFRSLKVGDRVTLLVEAAEQDGYHWRATWVGESNEGE
jgi:CspA family cold shock protein